MNSLRSASKWMPLVSALIAPTSTLFDIPALTQDWLSKGGTTISDVPANRVLSAIGLAFNVLANTLLMVRFAAGDRRWKLATALSTGCWLLKFAVALVNVTIFGALAFDDPKTRFTEGFWCAIVSLAAGGVINFLLLTHYAFRNDYEPNSDSRLQERVAGQQLMLQNTFFTALVGIMALVMSRLEHWTYLQGMYFAIETVLTVGFGDFTPSKPISKVLLFPLTLLGIAQLANIIVIIASYISRRARKRELKWRAQQERDRYEEQERLKRRPDLAGEILFLHNLGHKRWSWDKYRHLATNILGFLVLWLIGALVFARLESWTYFTGMYFCYIFFFAVGYGDVTPSSPAGRVLFVVFALLAVPIMTSLAVETVSNLFHRYSEGRAHRRRVQLGLTEDILHDFNQPPDHQRHFSEKGHQGPTTSTTQKRKWAIPHTHFVAEAREDIEKELSQPLLDDDESEVTRTHFPEDRILTEHILEAAVEIERCARKLLVAHLPDGSGGKLLLKADQTVQRRHVAGLSQQIKALDKIGSGEELSDGFTLRITHEDDDHLSIQEMDEKDTLKEIRRYRENFAKLLAAGSRVLKLKGEEKLLFERRVTRLGPRPRRFERPPP